MENYVEFRANRVYVKHILVFHYELAFHIVAAIAVDFLSGFQLVSKKWNIFCVFYQLLDVGGISQPKWFLQDIDNELLSGI